MLTSYVDVILTNSPRVSLDQGHLPPDHALLLEVLLEICNCGDLEDILQLLEDGETVTIGSRYDVLLDGEADNTLRVMTSPDSQDLLLNYQHVLEIVEGYRELDRVSRDVKFDLGLLQRDSFIYLPDKKSVGSSTKITEGINDSPFTGHAYNNMEVEEGVLHDGGFAKVLESLEQYNRLATRRHPDNFTTVSLPPNPLPEPLHPLPMDTSLDPSTQDDLFNTPASFLNTPPEDGRGRPWLSLTPEQIRQPHFSSSSPQPELVDDFLESSVPKDSPYPERLEGINFVGKLGELLQRHGNPLPSYQVITHSQTSFSAVLKFEYDGLKHEYESDARYQNKKDAKKNVAYTAYTAICPECIPVDDDNSSSVSSVAVTQPEPPTTIEEPAPRHKGLLQEFCQKRGFAMPKFSSVDKGDPMVHRFVSTVTIETPYGTIEETSSPNPQKKPSEFHAAFLAYQTLLKRESGNQLPATAEGNIHIQAPPTTADRAASSSTTRTNWNQLVPSGQENVENVEINFLQIKYNNSRQGHTVQEDSLVKSFFENVDTATVDKVITGLPVYNLSNRKSKGVCLIVNNMDYKEARNQDINLGNREGSDVDYNSIEKLFKDLKFDVEAHQNLSKENLDNLISNISSSDQLKNYKCFVTIFLSHGNDNILHCTDGEQKNIEEIINSFKGDSCSALNGVPKWFIIQACRGEQVNKEIKLQKDAGEDIYYCTEKRPISIPECADFYISYATAPGYYSFRHPVKGTWFIQCLLEILEKYHKREDVNTMMTRVNRKVAIDYVGTLDNKRVKQMPYHINMLTHALYI